MAWLRKRDRNPDLPPARVQVPKSLLQATIVAAIVSSTTSLGLTVVWLWEKARDREVYVYVVDQEGSMITRAAAHSKWVPTSSIWADAAMRWVEQVRSRSLDPGEYPKQLKRLSLTTDQSLWASVDQWMSRNRPNGHEARDVAITEALVESADTDKATVKVTWKERMRPANGGLMPESRGTATINLAKGEPRPEQEIDVHNRNGIYVVGFTFNPLQKLGRKEEQS
jgi:type IV secretory pathway TrbF-like protein